MTINKDKYRDYDDLDLFLTFIESSTITFNPVRTIEFRIIKPFDHAEKVLHYNSGTLTFENILYCDLKLLNELYEYPEFYRSAIIHDSRLLLNTVEKLKRLNEPTPKIFKHYYLNIDLGNTETEIHIICEGHNLMLNNNPRLLSEFDGFDK